MKDRKFLVEESLDLLRQIHGKAGDSDRCWMVEVEEVIVRLELYLHEGVDDPGRVRDILNVLARGLGAILVLHKLWDSEL